MTRAVVAYVLVALGGPLLLAGAWLFRLANRIDGHPSTVFGTAAYARWYVETYGGLDNVRRPRYPLGESVAVTDPARID